jgi:hypothetical protein
MTVCLLGLEKHKAVPDLGDDSGFWLRTNPTDAAAFISAFEASPRAFHTFLIEQRVGSRTRLSRLSAQIVEIQVGPTEVRILLRPNLANGAR